MPTWIAIVAAVFVAVWALLVYLRAACAELVARQCRADVATALELALTVARVVMDHETVDKLAAGVTWQPRDDLDKTLLEIRAQAEQIMRGR